MRSLVSSINNEGSRVRRAKSKRRLREERSGDGSKTVALSNEAKYPIVEHQVIRE